MNYMIQHSEWPKLQLTRLTTHGATAVVPRITKPRRVKYHFATQFAESELKEGIWEHSDCLIPDALREELMDGVKLLECVPDKKKDWLPGSNNQVWNLVHPSLFPVIYGQSRTVSGDIVERQQYGGLTSAFCLLPTEFHIRADGSVSIESYVNNIHPTQYKDLYGTLEKIFAKFVPLFESVLTDIVLPPPKPMRGRKKTNFTSRKQLKANANARLASMSTPVRLVDRSVQVIVKMTNIVLTPGNPSYPGGDWHVEGIRTENIVASGIYYYDVANISESELEFRQKTSGRWWGSNLRNQGMGSVNTSNDNCLVFPNIYQHRVGAFQLADPSKPGHRKILVFFLVNPEERILSTLTIPPQQLDWFLEELRQVPPFDHLPLEIVTHIVQFLDWPLSLTKAKGLRDEMIRERKTVVNFRPIAPYLG